MSIPRLLLATLVSAMVMLTMSWLWHGSFMYDFYAEHLAVVREDRLGRIVLLGYLLLAVLMSYLYPKGYEGGDPLPEGLRFGAVMGVLWTLPHAVVLYGVEGSHTGTLVIVDAAWHIAEQGLGGLAIALVHGRDGAGDRNDDI